MLRRSLFGAIAATPLLLNTPTLAQTRLRGSFEGRVIAEWLDGRGDRMRLEEPFSYTDPTGVKWDVPSGAVVNGASIPGALWSMVGHPFRNPYRNAAVVHDWYCDVRTRDWRDVHRMFFEALLDTGTQRRRAQMMYAGVLAGGPRWDMQAIMNNRLREARYVERLKAEQMMLLDQSAEDRISPTEGRDPQERPAPPEPAASAAERGDWRVPGLEQEVLLPPILTRDRLEPIVEQAGAADLSVAEIERLAGL